MISFYCIVFLFLAVESLEVILFDLAGELFIASGAHKVRGVNRAVKADGLAAGGAFYLVVFLVLTTVAVVLVTAITAIALAADAGLEAFALVAITVTIAVVTVAVAIASIAVAAVTIVVIAIAAIAIFHLVHEIFLDLAEVVVELFSVVVKGVDLLVYVLKLLAELAREVDERGNKLALGSCLVELEPVGKSLYVCYLFIKCHFIFLQN